VTGIPRGPAGRPIDIRFTYDLNGVLEAEATIVETKQKATHVFTRHARGLSAEAVHRAVADMQALKLHPREDAVNRFLLRRAERLYAELPLREREVLDGLLSGFEEVLELRDAEAMERYRNSLEEFLARFERYGEDDGSHPDGDSGW
jgi:molecular chaperone HscC